MGANERGGWSVALVAITVIVGIILALWLILPLIGILD